MVECKHLGNDLSERLAAQALVGLYPSLSSEPIITSVLTV